MEDVIAPGQYIVIQRQNYMKLHKVTDKSMVSLGKDQIDISPIVGNPFWSTYKMEAADNGKRHYKLSKCSSMSKVTNEIIKICTSGTDNREIIDDGSSQRLSTEEIINLKESGMSAQGIVSHLVENSRTFLSKTEYSQEKYLKKKEKKYFEYVTIRKPNLRLISEIFLRSGPAKVLGLRMDTLAQLTTVAGVRAGGTYVLYESACQGLVGAALLNCVGVSGCIVHVHPGHAPQKQALLSLNLNEEHLKQFISVSIQTLVGGEGLEVDEAPRGEGEAGKRKLEGEETSGPPAKRPRWREEAARAVALLKTRKADGLVIVGREHPGNIFKALVGYLEASRPFVVYCGVREPLQDLYCELKSRGDTVALRLTESWLRGHQVLPERTHPDINTSGSGGCLLSGIVVSR